MAGLKILLRCAWMSYWRGRKGRGFWHNANAAAPVVLAVLLLPGHAVRCVEIAGLLRDPATARGGGVMLEILLLGLLLAWLFAPLLMSSTVGRGAGIPLSRLAVLPLRASQAYLAIGLSMVIQPVYWLLAAMSFLCWIPIAALPSPMLGAVAGALFFVVCSLLAWTIGHIEAAVFTSRRAREVMMLVMSLLLLSVWILARADFERDDAGYWFDMKGRRVLLLDREGEKGVLARLTHATPSAWVRDAGEGRAVGLIPLTLVSGAAAAAGAWALRRRMLHPTAGGAEGRRKRSIAGPRWLRPPLGPAVEKELRYLMRTLDSLLCFLVGIATAVVLILRPEIPAWGAYLAAAFALFSEIAMPANAFGLDARAVDRYRLLPLAGRDVVLSKNVAYFALVAMQTAPIWLAQGIRHGPFAGLAVAAGTGVLVMMQVLWGNGVSLRAPAPRAFYSFDGGDQLGGLFSFILMMLMPFVPVGLAMGAARGGALAVLAAEAVPFLVLVAAYKSSLDGSGRLFDASAETMRARLSG